MNQICYEILISIAVLFIGGIFLLTIRGKTSALKMISLSWFLGWSLVCLAQIFLIVGSVNASLINVIMCLSFVYIIICSRSQYVFLKQSLSSMKYLISIIAWICLIVTSICVLFRSGVYTPDSLQYFSIANHFNLLGTVSLDPESVSYSAIGMFFFSIRLPFLLSVGNVASQAGSPLYFSFFPLTGIFFCLYLFAFARQLFDEVSLTNQKGNWLFNIVLITFPLILFVTPFVFFHTVYWHSSLTTTTLFTIGTLLLLNPTDKQNKKDFYLGVFFLATTMLVRKEMFLISILPFFTLFYFQNIPFKKRFIACIAYVFIGYSWQIYGFLKYFSISRETIDTILKGHGSILISLLTLLCAIVVFLTPLERINKRNKLYLPIIISVIAFLMGILIPFSLMLRESVFNLGRLLFFTGKWGGAWYVILITLMLFIIKARTFPSEKQRQTIYLRQIVVIISLFFFIRILLYTIFPGPRDLSWGNSGNRTLLTIYPLCVFLICDYYFRFFINLERGTDLLRPRKFFRNFFRKKYVSRPILVVFCFAILFAFTGFNEGFRFNKKIWVKKINTLSSQSDFLRKVKHGDLFFYGEFLNQNLSKQPFKLYIPDYKNLMDPFMNKLWPPIIASTILPVNLFVRNYESILSENKHKVLQNMNIISSLNNKFLIKEKSIISFYLLRDANNSKNQEFFLYYYYDESNNKVHIYTLNQLQITMLGKV